MRLYKLEASQAIPIRMEQAWGFLSDPANLSVITPPHMGFDILSGADQAMFAGQIIQYNVSPFPAVTTRWVTEITHVKEGEYFVDEQRFGPYALWHHKHFIKKCEGGVIMKDLIDYKLPLGILGQLGHSLLVKNQLKKIFAYREMKLKELFGEIEGMPSILSMSRV